MATLQTTATRPGGDSHADGKAYFETDTNQFVVWDATDGEWIQLDSDGTGSYNFNNFSLSLDGSDDYLETSFAPSSVGTSNYSISLWFNITTGASEDHPYFFAFGAGASDITNTYQGLGLTGRSDNGYKVRINNYYNSAYSQSVSSSTSDITAGNWYHFVLVRNGNTLTLYKDGVSFLTLSNSDVGLNNFSLGSNFRLGYGYGAASRYINGLVDELALFNSALSAPDIESIYSGGNPTDISSLNPVGWWRMGDNDGGTGATITNAATGSNSDGSSINGTIENGSNVNISPTYSTDVPT